jgi:hypothetical protein
MFLKFCSLVISLFTLFFFYGCDKTRENSMDQTKEEILKTDIEFSNTAVREGISSAFIKFAADDVVL